MERLVHKRHWTRMKAFQNAHTYIHTTVNYTVKKKVDIGKGWKHVIDILKHTGEQTLEKNKNRVHAHITGVWTYCTWPRDWEKTPSVAYDKKDRHTGH